MTAKTYAKADPTQERTTRRNNRVEPTPTIVFLDIVAVVVAVVLSRISYSYTHTYVYGMAVTCMGMVVSMTGSRQLPRTCDGVELCCTATTGKRSSGTCAGTAGTRASGRWQTL